MSNTKSNRPLHLGGLDSVLYELIEGGWVFGNPMRSSDRKSVLYKGIPPIGEFKIQMILAGCEGQRGFDPRRGVR